MAEPENHTIRLLQEIRQQGTTLENRIDGLSKQVDNGFDEVKKRMDSLHKAINAESILGRYAVADVEERLISLENRMAKLEKR